MHRSRYCLVAGNPQARGSKRAKLGGSGMSGRVAGGGMGAGAGACASRESDSESDSDAGESVGSDSDSGADSDGARSMDVPNERESEG